MRLIPSMVFNTTFSIIADDVMINPHTLTGEIKALEDLGIDVSSRLFVSPNAHLVLPYHKKIDELNEAGSQPLGTTKRGIGPAIADKVNRVGIRMEDFVDPEILRRKLKVNVEEKNKLIERYYELPNETFDFAELYSELRELGAMLRPFVRDTISLTQDALKSGASVLLEGAQGSMLDLSYGSYPNVTASRPITGGLLSGAAIAPNQLSNVLSIIKPYQTRVGIGNVIAEIFGETAEKICNLGNEFGTVTGRARRVMWFDAVLINYANRLNGTTAFALTKLDVMDELEEIKICTAYKHKSGFTTTNLPPQNEIDQYEPQFEVLEGWMQPTGHITRQEDLPENMRILIKRIEELTQTPIAFLSLGADRKSTIELDGAEKFMPGRKLTSNENVPDISKYSIQRKDM